MKTLIPLLIIGAIALNEAAAQPAKKPSQRLNLRGDDPSATRSKVRSTYGIRKNPLRGKHRVDVIGELGGSKETEAAVVKALDWLTKHQKDDGHWEETQSNVAHTGLAILVYLSFGVEPKDDTPHGQALAKALEWLIEQVPESGNMRDGGKMYGQAIGTLALGEAFGITRLDKLHLPLRRATDFLIAAQNPKSGGWRYQPHPSLTHAGDLSVSGWVIMALRSAEMAGMKIPNVTLDNSRIFMDQVAVGPHKGKYGYKNPVPKYCMTSVGMYCQQLFGLKPDHQRQLESANYLDLHLPNEKQKNYYYWYYGCLAMFLHGGEVWHDWNEKMVPIFLKKQQADGSWKAEGGRAKKEGTHITTCWAALSLTVYYRYLPMIGGYQRQNFGKGPGILLDLNRKRPNSSFEPAPGRINLRPKPQPKKK
jgi:hypothetical protein